MTTEYDVREFAEVTYGRKLGAGSFGNVYVGLLPSGRFVAVKQLELGDGEAGDDVNREVEVHKSLKHPNIIRYLHSGVDKKANPPRLNIYLEFVTGGSLTSIMKTLPDAKLPLRVAKVYTRHMLEGLFYLHKNGVAHRDIKGDNILVSQDTGIAKLADFDQAKVVAIPSVNKTLSGAVNSGVTKTLSGTPVFMAPEVIADDTGYNPFKADIWSAGCTLGEMLTGKAPWQPMQNPLGIMFKLTSSQGWPDAIPRDAAQLGGDANVIDFLDKCFLRDAKARPDAATLLNHPFLKL